MSPIKPSPEAFAAFAAGLQPDQRLTVAEWANARRVLDGSSAEPGPWRTDRTPYLREIMETLGDDDHEEIVCMMGSQLGKSEALLNWIGWTIGNSPAPFLLVQPTVDDGEAFSKQRVAPMLAATPSLARLVGDARSRDSGNTLTLKEFPGGSLRVIGSNAPSKLKSTPIKRVALDEVDTYPADAGGEGDPIKLARMRTSTFGDRKIAMTSTPTVEGQSRIERAFLASDQRRYLVPCPHCGEFQALQWTPTPTNPGGLVWERDRPDTAAYQCGRCGALIDESQKGAMLSGGRWQATAQSRVAGFHLSALYSPPGWMSWADLAREWIAATGNPEELKVFVNSRLAETWKLGDDTGIQTGTLRARAEQYRAEVPAGVQVLTAGVDVQDDRLEAEIVGWGAGAESWSIAWLRFDGDPSGPDVWRRLWGELARGWATESGATMAVAGTCIDTGGHHTAQVYAFCDGKDRVWPIKGRGGAVPVWPRKPSRGNKGKSQLYIVGVDTLKEGVYGRLRIGQVGPGYMHFPAAHPAAYYDQLTAERIVTTRYRGRVHRTWTLPPSKRNEVLDCRVYATAALHGLERLGLRAAIASSASRPLASHSNQVADAPAKAQTMVAPPARPQPPERKKAPSVWGRDRSVWG